MYVLSKHMVHHVHSQADENSTKKERVVNFLRNLPTEVDPSSMKNYVMVNLEVSRFTFYNALKEMEGTNRGIDFKTLLPYLE